MICWPNWRRRMPLRAISGFSSATPKMLLLGGIGIHAESRSGEDRWKKLRACDCRPGPDSKMRRSLSAVGGMRTASSCIAGLGGRYQMAYRADAADAGHERGHLVKRPAFAEFFEAAELGDVETGVFDSALIVEVEGDFGMALDTGYGIDQDRFALFAVHGSNVRHTHAPNLFVNAADFGIARLRAIR